LASLGVSADVARFGSLDAQVLGLAVDALIAGALSVDGLVERTIAIEQGAHQAAFFPVGVFDTAWAPDELGMLAGLSRAGGKEGKTRGLPALQAGSTLHPGRGGPLIPVPQTGFPLFLSSPVFLH